jgi:exonuclease VII small subunit
MPQFKDAPAEMNKIMEAAYSSALKKYKGNKAKASKAAIAAAENAGWKKVDGKWTKELADVLAKDFVIFKTGTWNGETFTEAQLDEMAKNFNVDEPPHLILGHSSDYKGKTMIPSWGRIKGGLKRIGNELIACGAEFNEQMAQWIRDGFFGQRSIELTKDNKRILAVGLLGAMPPAVKGLPLMQEVMSEPALQFSEFAESKVIEFQDAQALDFDAIEVEAVKDTLKNIDQEFATCLADIENHLAAEDEDEEIKKNCLDALMECYQNIAEEICEHFTFTGKLEGLEPEETETMMGKLKEWLGIKSINITRKENKVDAQKEKEFNDKIAALEAEKLALETQNKEFAEKERLAKEAQDKIEADKKVADLLASEEAQKTEIKVFCDEKIKDGKMTPAMREKDEPIMFELSKTNIDALKSFQEKYVLPVVPLGVVELGNQDNDTRSQVIKDAEKYAVAHANEKEFAGLDKDTATSRAFYLYRNGIIKFESNTKSKGAK